jgi:choline dehydrogenase
MIELRALERALIGGRSAAAIQAVTAAGLAGAGIAAWADELDAIRANQNERASRLLPAYAYIVVGAGSAACTLVGRLAARSDAIILMVEAGDWDVAPSVLDPGLWFTNLGTERDWQDVAIPSAGTNNRQYRAHG